MKSRHWLLLLVAVLLVALVFYSRYAMHAYRFPSEPWWMMCFIREEASVIVTLKYSCGCEWDYPGRPLLMGAIERPETPCPWCRGVVGFAWLDRDIQGGFVRLNPARKNEDTELGKMRIRAEIAEKNLIRARDALTRIATPGSAGYECEIASEALDQLHD